VTQWERGKRQRVTVRGHVAQWSESVNLGIKAYCRTRTEDIRPGWNTAGVAYLPLAHVAMHKLPAQFVMDLREEADNWYVKGKVKVCVVETSGMKPMQHVIRERLSRASGKSSVDELEAARDELMRRLENRSLVIYSAKQRYRPTNHLVRWIHCPEDMTEAGRLPGSFYTIPHIPTLSNEAYFVNLAEIALSRAGWTAKEFMTAVDEQIRAPVPVITNPLAQVPEEYTRPSDAFLHATRIVADMMTLFATACYYMGDVVNETQPGGTRKIKDVEHYKTLRIVYADDCEGLAREAYVQIRELQQLDTQNPLLHMVREVLAFFVPVLALGAVTMKHLSLRAGAIGDDDVIAHIFTLMLPREWVFSSLLSNLDVPGPGGWVENPVASDVWARNAPATSVWERGLPVLVLEGTGVLDPFPKPVADYVSSDTDKLLERDQVHRRAAFQRTIEQQWQRLVVMPTKRFQQSSTDSDALADDLSDFYKMVVSGYTDYFLERGLPFTDLTFVRHDPMQREEPTYGVLWSDLVFKHLGVRLDIPAVWGESELMQIEDVLSRGEPLPAIVCLSEADINELESEIRDQLLPTVRQDAISGVEVFSAEKPARIVYRVRPEDLRDDPELRKAIAAVSQTYRTRWQLRPLGTTASDPDTKLAVVDLTVYDVPAQAEQ
jgi:hypothetical protein